FFTAAAEAMRRILIDNARRKKSLKHGGDRQRINLDKDVLRYDDDSPADNLIALDEALSRLAENDSIKSEVVKLRYFAGMSIEQTAEI
ncbi:MAG TPA: RNA polymerase subunit sigma, partial [Phycisphaerales bacterium]|nr:RNA polymerase subunit sigma [Phycisphaerales bacterium]